MDSTERLKYCLKVCKKKTVRETRSFILDYVNAHSVNEEDTAKIKRGFDEYVESTKLGGQTNGNSR